MLRANRIFFSIFLFFLVSINAPEALACRSACSGCNLTNINKDRSWKNFYNTLVSRGVRPISCYRSYQCQVQLARTCGGRGRVAKPGTSNHQKGIAMDFRTSNGSHKRAIEISRELSISPIGHLSHSGGGYHMSNSPNEGGGDPYSPRSARVARYRAVHAAEANDGYPSYRPEGSGNR